MFSDPMTMLHSRLDKGDSSLIGDGLFVRPFLSDEQYLSMIDTMFKNDIQHGKNRPGKQMRIYLNNWKCPAAIDPVAGEVAAQSMLFDADAAKMDDVECAFCGGHVLLSFLM